MLDTERAETHIGEVSVETPAQAQSADKPATVRPFNELSGLALKAFFASWAAFTLVVVFAFSGKLDVLFNLGVVIVFGAMFFGAPVALLRIHRKDWKRAADHVDTLNGRMPQAEALVQIVMVPIILSVGMAAIGYFATHP
jgi:ABC-type protease/lipase transport system fused ATPase/permease subunit